MADKSSIEWTDATVNFWWGCTKVGPGCDHCYAETWAKRTGGSLWGQGVPRRKIKGAVALIRRLNDNSVKFADEHDGRGRRVFIQSMSDLFDLDVPDVWFAEAWCQIETCDRLDLQIVTKRISAVEKRLKAIGRTKWPKHAGLMITVVNQDEADRDIPRLLALKAKFGIPWVGLSVEPMLGMINLLPWLRSIDWVIVGGESGRHARPLHPEWPRDIRSQCAIHSVPFLFKQRGEYTWVDDGDYDSDRIPELPQNWRERKDDKFICMRADGSRASGYGGDSAEFLYRVGKKSAGRLLDGREHNEFPVTDSSVMQSGSASHESKGEGASL